jgi:photosystem II stability/assembly factor-like uncharacterized protein
MNKLSRRPVLVFLAYLAIALGLTLIVLRRQSRTAPPPEEQQESIGKKSDRLQPNELFYIDRNYPSGPVKPGLFQEKLSQAIAYDKKVAASNRSLDYPWTLEGPGNIGGRVNAIVVHPDDPLIIMIGYSQGGIYRTTDGGLSWSPVFDDQASLSISHISYDPHDARHVWAATGDVNISGYPFVGAGVYHSADGGVTWAYAGLGNTGVLSKVLVDPNDQDIIYAGSMGYPSQKGNERGLFRSTDGGSSWQKTLTIDDSTGVIDLVTDPFKAGRVFASGWKRIRSSKISSSLGHGTFLYRSEDYGATWTNVTNGLPDGEHSRTSIEITNDGTLFISYLGTIDAGECAGYIESLQNIYTSIDGGISWDTIPTAPEHGVYCDFFGQFGWYFEVLKVNPDNPLDMVLLGVDILRTVDGGLTWFEAGPPWWTYEVHADKHDLVFAHGNMYLGTDGGAYMTDINQAGQWTDIENIPTTQFYRTAWNPHTPDWYYGGAQDNGTSGGNATLFNEWPRIFGGDGFQPLFDRDEPTWMYAMTQNGYIYFTEDNGFDFSGLNKGLQGSRYWDMPLVMSSQDPKILFCGSDRMFRIDMHDTLREWQVISPDLTRGETILGNRYPAITAIAQSELDEMRLYAGTQDGLLWTTADGGLTWTNITEGTPGFYVTSISCSTIHPEGVIATYSGYRDNDHQPYIFRSEDAGSSWEPIHSDLPMMGVNNLFILPGWNDAVLFAATDGGVYVSQDAGEQWSRIGSNMPYMPVYDLDYNPVANTLIAATFSRGIMTFPIEELDLVSSIDEEVIADSEAFEIFPTCVDSKVFVKPAEKTSATSTYTIHLYSMNGVQVAFQKGYGPEGCSMEIPVALQSGTYLVSVEHESKLYHQLVVKL